MKMSQASRLVTLGVAMGVLSVGTVLGAEPKHITRVHQPTPKTKTTALAPRATKQRVFGAPIQGTIMHHRVPRKKPPR